MSRALKTKISKKKAKIAVIGLGYVGLPLAVSFAKKGFSVTGIDKNEKRVSKIQKKISYISDVPAAELRRIVTNKKLTTVTDFKVVAEMDVIIICVPTPLKRKYTPDISYIMSAVRSIQKRMKRGCLIILESTTYPGTTDEMIKPLLERGGMKAGKDFYLSFSPERIDPGNKTYKVTDIPKVVGGYTRACSDLTKALYEKIIKSVHVVSSPRAAEMTKLLENSFRIINIGWINEVAMMSHSMGIDIWEVIDAAKTKPFGFMPFYPGLGVGGHCIPDDPLYLYWKAKHHGYSSKYIRLSADTNRNMPQYVVTRIQDLLKKKSLKSAKVLVVGVTYKKDVKDLRKSPPVSLIEILQQKKCKVDYYDPIIPYLDFKTITRLESVPLTPTVVKRYDCVVIATDHSRINYTMIDTHAKKIFDIRNVYKNKVSKKVTRL